MSKKWFVTGTDTEVGKTLASCALLQAAGRLGYRTAGYKPVASGCEITPQGLRNSDAQALQRYSTVKLTYEQVNPIAFLEPTAPHILREKEQRPISFATLSPGLESVCEQADWVVVEGAGGWFTPLSATTTFADWVIEEQLPVILVVGVKLGCINHALLSALAIRQAGLPLAGWIANTLAAPGEYHAQYLASLQHRLPAPLLGEIPYLPYDHHNKLPDGTLSLFLSRDHIFKDE